MTSINIPFHRFERDIVVINKSAKVLSKCLICAESTIGSYLDGSIETWEAKHTCSYGKLLPLESRPADPSSNIAV
jgi:hypothetical protein